MVVLLLLFGALTTLGEAYSKGPIYNGEYIFAQYLQMVVIPMIIAASLLVMIGFYVRQGVKTSA